MKMRLAILFSVISFTALLFANNTQRNSALLNENNVTVEMWNYGSFSAPGNRATDFVWNGLGYAYEIGFFVGAEVEVPQGSHPDVFQEEGTGRWLAHIISDGLKSSGAEISPDGLTRWGWQPIASKNNGALDYFDLSNSEINGNDDYDLNGNGMPDGWPESWWNEEQEKYVWPGLWGRDQRIANSEKMYGMDDRDNREFEYFPFGNDSSRRGLGVEVEVRTFQIADFYDDVVFVTMDFTNISDRDLDKMLFGLWGDPHIGGADDWRDDWQAFDAQRNMLYAWDDDGISINNPSITPGYFGISFMQTPGNSGDGIDNDNDGMTDESQKDGIDNDGDWNAASDDLGADGIAGTSDPGEGDGIPTVGEPNFEFKDMDEADMLGITSFRSPAFAGLKISDDEKMWQLLEPGNFDTLAIEGDYLLTGGSAYFSLKKGETKRVGFIFAFGQDLTDLQNTVDYASAYYHDNLGSQSKTIDLSISEPQNGSSFDNAVTIQWDASVLPAEAELFLSYRSGIDGNWIGVASVPNTGSYSWNTESIANSAFYKVRLRSVAPVTNAFGENDGYFTIVHAQSGNTPPEVFFDFPAGRSVQEAFNVSWQLGDADGDALDLKLIVLSEIVRDTISVSGTSYLLDTKKYANGACTLILSANDGNTATQAEHNIFINNEYPPIPESSIAHRSGSATGEILAAIVAEEQLKRNNYFISFDDTSAAEIRYSVFDSLNHNYLIEGDELPDYPQTGRLFDGMRLSFKNDPFAFNADASGWSTASVTNMTFDIIHENSYAEDPYDYEILFYDHIVDTTVNNVEVNYRITDLLNNTQMETAVPGSNTQWQPGETIYILRGGTSTSDIVWKLDSSFPNGEEHKNPGAGDLYYLKTHKSFTYSDNYTLNTSTVGIENNEPVLPQQIELAQNYPNPFNNSTTIRVTLPQGFYAELDIFDVSGQRVKTLFRGEAVSGVRRFAWDGRTERGVIAASGLYFYRLKTKRGSVVKKLILMK